MQADAARELESRRNVANRRTAHIILLLALLLLGGAVRSRCDERGGRQRVVAAERALQSNAERLRVTLASIGDGVIAADERGCVVSLNPVAEALTGWTQAAQRPAGRSTRFRIVGESRPGAVENPAQRALRQGFVAGLANHTVLIRPRDGAERPSTDSAAPIRDREGRVAGVRAGIPCIARRRQDEQALQASSRALATNSSTSSPGAIYTSDGRRPPAQFNAAATQLSGRVPELGSDLWFRTWTLYRARRHAAAGGAIPMAAFSSRVAKRGR